MSLFPAYSTLPKSGSNSSDDKNDAGPSWLCNSSYQIPGKQDEETCNSRKKISKRKEPSHKKPKKLKVDNHEDADNSKYFYEDTTPSLANDEVLSVPQVQLTKPVLNYQNRVRKKKKKSKRKFDKDRYFYTKIDKEDLLSMDTLNPRPMPIEEFLKKTEMYNKMIRNDHFNIKIWLEYVELQDSGEGSMKGRAEKKISILDKALEDNPESEDLIHTKMLIIEKLFPMDKITNDAKAIVKKYPKNRVGWLWIVNSTLYNLSKMTAPGVLLMFEEVLQGTHKAYNGSGPFIDFIFQCGLFLRQCGLWEQLWALMELYLELNLTTAKSGAFKINVKLPEDEIQQLEDDIITSGLPLGSLWLRVERLREGIYFLPVEESSDPQRIVFQEDMTALLFPIMQSSSSQLIIDALILLKVPPLPNTEAFFNFAGLHKIPWFLDSVEFILAAKFSKGISRYLDIAQELLVGPQYISKNLGQKEFFVFVNSVFDKCISNCKTDRTCFLVWQIRWWRWIYSLQRPTDNDNSIKKYYLGLAKKLLKQNRDCIPLYTEYALLEDLGGDFNASIKVLETTIFLREPPLLIGLIHKRDLYHLYRVYIDLLIRKDSDLYREKILTTLIGFAFGESVKNIVVRDELIQKCSERFQHITTEVVQDMVDCAVTFPDVMFVDFPVSWLICHAWYLFITKGIWESVTLLEETIKKLQESTEKNTGSGLWIRIEHIYEGLVEIFNHYCSLKPGNYGKLFEITERAVKLFPNNCFFLNTIYSCEVSGIKWPRFVSDIIDSGSVFGSAVVYFMTHTRYLKDDSLKTSVTNRLETALNKLKCSFDRCPLFWRLFLQASCLKDSETIKNTFYRTLEKCPWLKILYYEAAKILPEDLPEIQDLLVEKELRLHITPEELEILREG